MDALDYNPLEDDAGAEETIEDVVARIKASGRGQVLPQPPADAVRRVVAQLANEPVMSQEEQAEWNRAWFKIMDEMKRIEREDEIAEGRG